MARPAATLLALAPLACAPLPPDTQGDATTRGDASTTQVDATETTTEPPPTEPTTSTTVATLEPTTEAPLPVCGDGVRQGDEACDDGNLEDGDCCTAACTKVQVEPGGVCWTTLVEGTKNALDEGGGIAVDAAGDLYLAALTHDAVTQADARIQKFDPGGASVWTQLYDGGVNATDTAQKIAAEPSGFMVAIGRQTLAQGDPPRLWLSKCTPTGQLVWAFTDESPIGGAAVAMAGSDFVIAGSITQAGDPNGLVRRYDADGQQVWTHLHIGDAGKVDGLAGVAVDGAGNIYAAGRETVDGQGFDILVLQLLPDGTPGWSDRVDGGAQGNDWASDIAVDAEGRVYVAGRAEGADGFADAWLARYDAEGALQWTGGYAGEFGGSDEALAIAAGPGGAFVAAGRSAVAEDDSDLWVRRFDADGQPLWTDLVAGTNGGDDEASDLAFTPDGGVVVVGTLTVAPGLNSDVWLRKYGP